MNIFDSPLFKDFARPLIQQRNVRPTHHRSPAGIIDSIRSLLVARSELGVELCMISDATADSFRISIQYYVKSCGVGANAISPATSNMTFNGVSFGKLALPNARASFFGAQIKRHEQRVTITDMVTFQAFMRSLILNDETNFQLESVDCANRETGSACVCGAEINVKLPALGGPRMTLKNISSEDGDRISVTFQVASPSSVKLAFGRCMFEIRNDKGKAVASLEGNLTIIPGRFDFILRGRARPGAKPSLKNRLVGVGVVSEGEPSWCQEAVRQIDTVFEMPPSFAVMLHT
ncbi:hypothetical protein BGZ63DRAFT_10668 [Mariannaea sp. PMI_226]|nr:hypothetical protein BGZ63DRAFT_10668 [Mariannaea sp. PMI_226]